MCSVIHIIFPTYSELSLLGIRHKVEDYHPQIRHSHIPDIAVPTSSKLMLCRHFPLNISQPLSQIKKKTFNLKEGRSDRRSASCVRTTCILLEKRFVTLLLISTFCKVFIDSDGKLGAGLVVLWHKWDTTPFPVITEPVHATLHMLMITVISDEDKCSAPT